MSRCPCRTDALCISDERLGIRCIVADSLLLAHTLDGVLGTSRTASCHVLKGYSYSVCSPSELLPLPPLGVVPPV